MKERDFDIVYECFKLVCKGISAYINPSSAGSFIEELGDVVADAVNVHAKAYRVSIEKICEKVVPASEKNLKDIQSAKIEECNMRCADMSNADFQRAIIFSTHFGSTILDNSSFIEATLNGINFRNAELYFADFTNATIKDAIASDGGFDNVIGGDGKIYWQIKWVMDELDINTVKEPAYDDADGVAKDDPEDEYWIVNNWNSLDPFFRRDNYWDY